MFDVNDLTALYQLAMTASIKANQATAVAILFQKCETAIRTAALNTQTTKENMNVSA